MYIQSPSMNCRKRERNEDVVEGLETRGFTEHRRKRQMAALPLRQSPEIKKRQIPTFTQLLRSPTVADITPTGSDSEDMTFDSEPRSFFSPWPSSALSLTYNSLPPNLKNPQPSQIQSYSNDLEMTDSGPQYPGSFQSDLATNLSGRIPTPIHCQFPSRIHPVDKALPQPSQGASFANNEPIGGRSRRLPSPISEDGTSPSYILESLGDMQMDVEPCLEEQKSTPKKGHTRSKHSLRAWGGPGSDLGCGSIKRGFSMGYRSDCEKCRMKVPGHFSHIITY